jgi:hypothetical protein
MILLRTRRANMSIQNGGSTGQKSLSEIVKNHVFRILRLPTVSDPVEPPFWGKN